MKKNIANLILSKKYWFTHFIVVSVISIWGLFFMADQTYDSAPPMPTYVDSNGAEIISPEEIMKGQHLFLTRGLMNYGSVWGDGGERGPDYSAESLHFMGLAMQEYYAEQITPGSVTRANRAKDWKFALSEEDKAEVEGRVIKELHVNNYDPETDTVALSDAQVHGVNYLRWYYNQVYTNDDWPEAMKPSGHITDPQQIKDLSSFFYWTSWAAVSNRPGENYSYTHNWPHDPSVGNLPTAPVMWWSYISMGVLFLGIMIMLYVYGQMRALPGDPTKIDSSKRILTTDDLENGTIRPTQKKVYKFFIFAVSMMVVQVICGVLMAMDFSSPFAGEIANVLPFTILRSYHLFLQIYWFFMMWVGYTLFFLPRLAPVPKNQGMLIDILFYICLFIGVFGGIGIYLGQAGILTGDMAVWFGSQGWEFMEPGRFYFFVMLGAFSLWIWLIFRGVRPWITIQQFWSIPAWLLWGSGIMVFFLFFGIFATVDTNFAISDFWRWMIVHMWVEVTFEVFTTVIVGYILVQLGFVSRQMAERVIYIAVILFLITATIGVAHNFYWIAKPTGVIALGSVFSTLQILPLLLLTFDAYQMRRDGKNAEGAFLSGEQKHLMEGVWLFILAVNFWNIFGAGVLGSMINLPIINYFEHATYLTGNHAHAAMFGVKGNVSLAGMLFVLHHLVDAKYWNPKLIKFSFWSLNIGLVLMLFLDLFPVGLYQFMITLEDGLWLARSTEIIGGETFQFFTDFRAIGGLIFIAGVLSMTWFVISRSILLKPDTPNVTDDWHTTDMAKVNGKKARATVNEEPVKDNSAFFEAVAEVNANNKDSGIDPAFYK